VAHRNRTERDRAYVWPWRDLAPLIDAASILESMSAIERRILSLVSPHITTVKGFGTATNISTGLQILMPGEAARAHRHSMNAFRFVLQGEGATTIVDGKHCEMAYGDLISTPAWSWHEHVNKGSQRVVWLDVLDASLHRYLGTDVFEAGPAPAPPSTTPDSAYAVPGLVPEGAPHSAEYSPFYRYAWSEVVVALRAAPLGKDGARRVRYVNPHGGPVMSLLDCWAMELAPGAETLPFRTSANLV
jgi:gentisate 1,2-dioxygenase